MAFTLNSSKGNTGRPDTVLGAAIDQIHDHRMDSRQEGQLRFCPSGIQVNTGARRPKVPGSWSK